jgi:hypothetical protein
MGTTATVRDDQLLALAAGEYLAAWPVVFGGHNIFSSLSNYCGGGYHSLNGLIHSTFSVATDDNCAL